MYSIAHRDDNIKAVNLGRTELVLSIMQKLHITFFRDLCHLWAGVVKNKSSIPKMIKNNCSSIPKIAKK